MSGEDATMSPTGDGSPAMNPARELPVADLRVDELNPRQEPGDVDGLAASLFAEGVNTPLVVRQRKGAESARWGVLSGSRRLAAARQVGLETVPCIVRELADADAAVLALAENVGHHQLDPIEEARAYELLSSGYQLTNADIARRVGVSAGHVSKRRQLLRLSTEEQQQVSAGELSIDRAYARACRQPTKEPAGHGTRARYAAGCGCAMCKGKNAQRARARRNGSTETVPVPRELVDRAAEQGVSREGVGELVAGALSAKLDNGQVPSNGKEVGNHPNGCGDGKANGVGSNGSNGNGSNGSNGHNGNGHNGSNGHTPDDARHPTTPLGKVAVLLDQADVQRIEDAAHVRGMLPGRWLHEAIWQKWALEGPAHPAAAVTARPPTSSTKPTQPTPPQPAKPTEPERGNPR